ncbi:disintegrin and metalloproteinase with thrombospondin motifs 3 [Collichthys lucidus]|uniref:Disintegrin and metalloproteinase with thrombospondin motifs 3 n=1 Tax=Collichthys lucidus TaxID=240159 RepID=A0A4U5UGB9_COLLU|nr:disintegrin and metalloproteinase with thrombospondin motifs 3 [Collichthys lucidus]
MQCPLCHGVQGAESVFTGMAASLWDEALLELEARPPSIIQTCFDSRQPGKIHLSCALFKVQGLVSPWKQQSDQERCWGGGGGEGVAGCCAVAVVAWLVAPGGELHHTGARSPTLSPAQFGAAMGLSPGFTVLIILPAFLLHTSGLYIASSVDSLQHVLGEYGLVRPISVDAEGRFLSHAVSAGRMAGGQPRRRRRREERLYYNVTIFGREFHLRLHHNARLVAPGAKVEWRDDSDSTRHSEPLHDECLYVGDVTDTPGATVAISNCDGLVSTCTLLLPF